MLYMPKSHLGMPTWFERFLWVVLTLAVLRYLLA
jgi:hypothetical protein